MLLVGDLHITTKYKDKIIDELSSYIDQHPEENTIIFLGDYVYHFSYDRNALLALYHFFVQLFDQGKTVYVLAGNHDWIGDSFVFEEAQKAFSLLEKYKINHTGQLKFITEPVLETIEGQQILLFPYTLKSFEKPVLQDISPDHWLQRIAYLKESSHKNEQKSREINSCLAWYLETYPDLLVIHHHYINATAFPGQKSKFSYKDIALSEQLLDIPAIKMISGHLHQGFIYKNYFCAGSIRSTSSLEINQEKYLFTYTTKTHQLTAIPLAINPYFQRETNEKIDQTMCNDKIAAIIAQNRNNFNSDQWKIYFKEEKKLSLSTVSLVLKVEHIDYEQIDMYIDPELKTALKDIKLKKQGPSGSAEWDEKMFSTEREMNSFSDWKTILKSYLIQKFGDDYLEYENLLHELRVL